MKKYILFAIIIALAGLIINYSLGGFKPVEPGLISVDATTIYGRWYEGRYNSETLDELLGELRAKIAESNIPGQITIVNYLQPELEKRGTVKQFVGIIWQAKPAEITYDSLILEAYNGAQFSIPVRPLVMPSPEKLKRLAESMAADTGTLLAGYSIEQYQDKTLVINFPFTEAD